jgi:hypothetical protein
MSSPIPAGSPTPSISSHTAFETFRSGLHEDMREELFIGLMELQKAGADDRDLFHEGFEEDTARWLVRYRCAVVSNIIFVYYRPSNPVFLSGTCGPFY